MLRTNGTYKQEQIECDDYNDCTADQCDASCGCTHETVVCASTCLSNSILRYLLCMWIYSCWLWWLWSMHIDTCDCSNNACVNTPIDCNDNDKCTGAFCSEVVCYNIQKDDNDDCTDEYYDDCTIDNCWPSYGCVHTNTNCDNNDACIEDDCHPACGSINRIIDCNDDYTCTTDDCNAVIGCTYYTCCDGNPCWWCKDRLRIQETRLRWW